MEIVVAISLGVPLILSIQLASEHASLLAVTLVLVTILAVAPAVPLDLAVTRRSRVSRAEWWGASFHVAETGVVIASAVVERTARSRDCAHSGALPGSERPPQH